LKRLADPEYATRAEEWDKQREKEEDWCAFLPAPTPPEGNTEAVKHGRS